MRRRFRIAYSYWRCYSCSAKLLRRRVVCTGIGLITPLGCGKNYVWDRLINGKCGISINDREGFTGIPSKVAGFIPLGTQQGCFDEGAVVTPAEKRTMPLSAVYALAAAKEALVDANWHPHTTEQKERTGVAVGAGMVGLDEIANTTVILQKQGYRKVTPYFVPRILINMGAGQISIRHGLMGPNHAVSTACTTGAHAIGDAKRMIEFGDADVMVCGGSDGCIFPTAVAGFCRARALSVKFNEKPQEASRPFDRERDGFVIGEGAGIMVLEEYEHARARNASIYAEVLGYGLSGDAYHITAPSPDGRGAKLSMKSALRDAGLTPHEIQYINAHATSTPLGDAIENRAIKHVFGSHAKDLQVSSNKGAIGHLLGAAGSVEAIFTVLAIHKGIVPPTLNLHCPFPEEECTLNYVPGESQLYQCQDGMRKVALTNSFGFGGTNASLCFGELV